MQNLKSILLELPILRGMTDAQYDLLVGCAKNERAVAGTFLFREGEDAVKFYVVREGRISVELHQPGRGPLSVLTAAEGDILGWSWLFPPYTWHFDARVLDDARLVSFDGKCLRTKCEKDVALGYELLKRFSNVMTQRIEALSLQLMDVYGDHA